jgi:hypothetical protein
MMTAVPQMRRDDREPGRVPARQPCRGEGGARRGDLRLLSRVSRQGCGSSLLMPPGRGERK